MFPQTIHRRASGSVDGNAWPQCTQYGERWGDTLPHSLHVFGPASIVAPGSKAPGIACVGADIPQWAQTPAPGRFRIPHGQSQALTAALPLL